MTDEIALEAHAGDVVLLTLINIDGDMYVAEVESFTHKCKNHVIVAQKFLSPEDHVLLIDDFLGWVDEANAQIEAQNKAMKNSG